MKERTFKNWLSFCWVNKYILYFIIAFIAQIAEIVGFGSIADGMTELAYEERFGVFSFTYIMCCFGILIPLMIMLVVVYKGMYQHWNDWTHGRTR